MSKSEQRTFFRQGAWMMIATLFGGFFMAFVHIVTRKFMNEAEWSVFYTLLRVFLLMGIPAGGLQTVFAQQTAASASESERRELTGAARTVLQGTFLLWLLMVVVVWMVSAELISLWKIVNPAALWLTVALGLGALWLPVLKGLLMGSQNFMGLGWVLILDGVARFTAVVLIVLAFKGQAAGGMLGAVIGQAISLGVALWFTRGLWRGPTAPVQWRRWWNLLVPLTLSSGAVTFMSLADSVFVQSVFKANEAPGYNTAALVGFALAQFITPLAVVMFPKIARSTARSETSNALYLTLKSTAFLGGLAALVCTFFPSLPLLILLIKKSAIGEAAPLVPWFAWALLIITLANVLVSNLLARGRFRIVPWLVIIALAYGTTLLLLTPKLTLMPHLDAFRLIIQTMGGFNLALLVIAGVMTRGVARFVRATV